MDAAGQDRVLDIENADQLVEWLRRTDRLDRREGVRIEILTGGVSNRVVRVLRPSGDDWVLKQALPKLRVQEDWSCPVERIHREALGMRWLPALVGETATPKLLFEDHAHHVIGMEAVPIGFVNWKEELLAGRLDPSHFVKAGILLARLHSESRKRAAELQPIFADQRYFELLRSVPFYLHTAQSVPEMSSLFLGLTRKNSESEGALVHGDYSPKNLLIHDGALVLVDHEVIHWGDPMFDVGFVVAHFLSKMRALPDLRTSLANGIHQFWRGYSAGMWGRGGAGLGKGVENRGVRHAVACLAARARGKSPMGYLDEGQRGRQVALAVKLARMPGLGMAEVVEIVAAQLEAGHGE